MIMFIGLFYSRRKCLTLMFKVRDKGYRIWILFKIKVYG